MWLGEDIAIKGNISSKLFYNMTQYFIPLFSTHDRKFKNIKVSCSGLTQGEEAVRSNGVGTGFSAGIDSFAALQDHISKRVPENFNLTHLIFNNVGAHSAEDPSNASKLFEVRFKPMAEYAQLLGLSIIKIDSNLSDLTGMSFLDTHLPRNLSCALLLQRVFAKFYYASTYQYADCKIGRPEGIAHIEPHSVHLFSTEALDCSSTGCQHSRIEKTRLMTQAPYSARYLNVCVYPYRDGSNCSSCGKCCRTLLTLEMLGKLDDFAAVFNLEIWRKVRPWYIRGTMLNPSKIGPLVVEMRDFAKTSGFEFSFLDRLFGAALGLLGQRGLDRLKTFAYQRVNRNRA